MDFSFLRGAIAKFSKEICKADELGVEKFGVIRRKFGTAIAIFTGQDGKACRTDMNTALWAWN
jgi:hypothetical protein